MAIRRKSQPAKRVSQEDKHRINSKISAPNVRLVGDNVEIGVYSTRDALKIADEQGFDLVEISPNADPPVCKVMDYKKFLYEQKKRDKVIKAKATKVVIKEIRFGPQTDDHDYDFKKKHAEKFLKEGAKLKAFVFFKGRSIVFKEQGQILLLRLAQDLEEFGKVEQMPQLEGKRMTMFIAPKK
ncbi:translation initiation factor IF-3 [Mariniflexile sp. HNIBRBA6329]|uniref:translation initiation factor IF-3 n=1 Tax=Mariniflexile sp. HNIBRBA6329 TaxID=3373088 RepID=UPI0037472027